MVTVESKSVIKVKWNNQFINVLVDELSKKVSSNVYISKDGDSRQVAMKSVIGLLSGGFREGDAVKITIIGDNQNKVNQDMALVERLIKGEDD